MTAITAMNFEDLLVTRPEPGVLLVTLNRPAARNALRTATLEQLAQVLDAAAADAEVGAVVLAASHDRNEGIAAFLERRPPSHQGR
jgi:enoyl-CoA hydratase/carnithine racemase